MYILDWSLKIKIFPTPPKKLPFDEKKRGYFFLLKTTPAARRFYGKIMFFWKFLITNSIFPEI